MKTTIPQSCKLILALLATLVTMLLPTAASAASITWGTPTTMAGDTDVSTAGSLLYAYDASGTAATVNTVPFAAASGSSAWGAGVTFNSGWSGSTTTAYGSGSGNPWSGLSSAYRIVLEGGAYGGASAATLTLNNLTTGHAYQVQVWVVDTRGAEGTRTETVTSTGGNTVTLAYNSTGTNGGVGQYTIGTFTASATTQTITLTGNSSSQLNAIQVRDQTTPANGVWNTTTSGALWGTATDWLGNTIATGYGSTADFSQQDITANTTVNLDSAWMVGNLIFGNTDANPAASWILANNGTAGDELVLQGATPTVTVNNLGAGESATISAIISGSSGLVKAGAGTLVLSGANTYIGGTTVSAGTLQVGVANAIPGNGYSGDVSVNGTLDLNTFNDTINGLNGSGTVDTVAGGAPILTLGANGDSGTFSGVIQNTAGTLTLVKSGGGTETLSGANTFSGLAILNQGTLTFLGNQINATGGADVGTNVNPTTFNIGSASQSAPTLWTIASTSGIRAASGASQYSTINLSANSAEATIVTNNGTMIIGRDSGFTVNAYATWLQNGAMTIQANGGYPANFNIAAGGNFIYTGVPPITNSAPGSSGSTAMSIAGTFTTGQGFYDNDSGTTGYPVLTLASGGTLVLSANVGQLVTPGGSGPVGKFYLGTNATINTAGFSTAEGLVLGNAASQTGSLVKSGAGTLELDAANTYTGPTTIRGGTLLLGSSASLATSAIILTNSSTFDVTALGGFTLGSSQPLSGSGAINGAVADSTGSQISPGGAGAIGALNFNSTLTLAGGDTLIFDFSNGGSNDVINAGALTLNGTTTINLAKWPLASGFLVGNYVLMQATNGISGGGSFTLLNAPGRQNCQIVINTIGSLQQVVLAIGQSGAPANLFWLGGNGNSWDVQGTQDWLNNSVADFFYSGDHVTFSNVPAANAAVNVAALVAPSSVVFTGTNNYVIESSGGYITGVTALTQNGPGTVTLATSNDYSGVTTINGGALQLGDGNANNGTVGGNIADNATLVLANPTSQTLTNGISGPGTLVVAGTGGMILTGDNTYTGGTTISSNVMLQVASSSALGVPESSILALIETNGSLDFNLGAALTETNAITGAGSVVQADAYALTLAATNTFSGGLTINQGAIYAGNNQALGTGPITIDNQSSGNYSQLFLKNGVNVSNAITIVNASSYYQGILMVDAGTYGYGGANGSGGGGDTNGATFSGPITLAPGSLGHGGQFCGPINGTNWLCINGPVTNSGGSVIIRNGRVQFSGGGDYAILSVASQITALGADNGVSSNADLLLAASGAATFDLNGHSQSLTGLSDGGANAELVTNSAAPLSTFTLNLSANSTFSGVLAGNLALVENGSANLYLAGNNAYTGNTTVNGGTLELANPTVAPNSTVTVANGAVLQLDFAVTNQVAGLVLNGVSQPPGVYTPATSSPYLAGNGSLLVVSPIAMNPTNLTATVSGNSVIVNWPADHTGWVLQSQTNALSSGLGTNWVDLPNSAAVNSVTNGIDPSNPTVFFRLRAP